MLKIVTITPCRDRVPQIKNHLRSLLYQTRLPDQVIVSCHGDTEERRREIVDFWCDLPSQQKAPQVGFQLWAMGSPEDDWCKGLAVNWAVRRTPEDVDIIVTFDADMILHPEHLELVERAFEEDSARYVMCPNLTLTEEVRIDDDWTYDGLRMYGRRIIFKGRRGRKGPITLGWGGCQGATRDWWFEVRGIDESL